MKKLALFTAFVFAVLLSYSVLACPSAGKEKDCKHNKSSQVTDDSNVKNGFKKAPAPGTKAYCPVMETDFTVKKGSSSSVYNGKTYVFCCPGCKTKFDKEPKKYIKKLKNI